MDFKKLPMMGWKYITDKNRRFQINAKLGLYDTMPDEEYLKKIFPAYMGKALDLDHPKTFNEKLQWLKLYDRKPEYTMMVDKYLVRQYISEKIGEKCLIPLLGVWDDPEKIDFDALPNRFVLKCNHNSGMGMCICRDKSNINIQKIKHDLRKGLKQDYYLTRREWPYKDVPRKIIAEKYMEDSEGKDHQLYDYKFYCFNGKPLYLYVSHGLENHETAQVSFLSLDWKKAPFGRLDYKPFKQLPKKPTHFEQMIEMAKTLSKGIPFLRVDLYEISEQIYFGELTFFPCAGFMPFDPPEWDQRLGKQLILPEPYK